MVPKVLAAASWSLIWTFTSDSDPGSEVSHAETI